MPRKPPDIQKLNSLYEDADRADKEVFAEMRSNVLLIAGEHYNRRTQRTGQRLRSNEQLTEAQKLRLTKNHIHKVVRHYVANILSQAPGTVVLPQKDQELHDQKAAELNESVWQDAKYKYRMREKVRQYAHDYVGIGEVAVKLFWDPNKGPIKGYEGHVDEFKQPIIDPATGQQAPNMDKPVFTGEFVFERIFGFNLFRAAWSKDMRESPFMGIRKLTEKSHLEETYADQPDKLKLLSATSEDDFIVFDSDRARYTQEKKQIMIREFYWRPCREYPNGYYQITTKEGILEEGELPFGIFPIVWAGFDEHPTAARARSIIKVARPFQAEINRASSQMAMHQITVGDDKVIYQAGTKLAPGALLPGVRGVTYQGAAPQILPGRDGSQFLPYIQAQVIEMYDVLMMEEMNQEKPTGTLEAWTLLYRQLRDQLKYSEYGEKFEQFLIDLNELFLQLARHYLDDEALVYAVGSNERINIAEFRSTTPLCYSVKVEAQSETPEELFGRQITMTHALQYIGGQLSREDIGRVMKNMPYGNYKDAFADFTIDQENVENDMLAIERNEQVRMSKFDNHEYAAKRLVARMKQPDFRYLPENQQEAYNNLFTEHNRFIEEQAAAIAAAKNQFIPTGGALIAADMYVPNEADPSKAPKRVRVPYQALDWLVNQLETQGMTLDKMESMNKGMLSEMANHLVNGGAQGGAPTQPGAPQLRPVQGGTGA